MKNISVVLLSLLVGSIITGCKKEENKDNDFLSYEEITDIYYANRELINSIKDELFSSDFIPNNGMTEFGYNSSMENRLFLSYDYTNKQLVCSNDPQGEKLQSIQNVHSDIIEYFKSMNRNYNPGIGFRKDLDLEDVRVLFEFRKNVSVSAGIVYTTMPEILLGATVHLENNWYAYKYMVP